MTHSEQVMSANLYFKKTVDINADIGSAGRLGFIILTDYSFKDR